MESIPEREGDHQGPGGPRLPGFDGPELDDSVSAVSGWYDHVMAKAKRRKLRARRSKANHGRRPNAGRG